MISKVKPARLVGSGTVCVCAGLLLAGCMLQPSEVRTFIPEEFGAAGDGVHDDSLALKEALAAMRHSSGPVRLVFSEKTYRLGKQTDSDAQFDLSGMSNVEVDGRGATLILNPVNGVARFFNSRNVTFKNFVIQHDPLPFMQGTVVSADKADGSFLWEIQDGFPLPPSGQWMKKNGHFFDNPAASLPNADEWETRNGPGGPWQWGIVIEAESRRLKPDFPNHLFVDSVVPVDGNDSRIYRVSVAEPYRKHIKDLSSGERFVLPRFRRTKEEFFSLKDRGWMYEQNVQIRKSSDIKVENVTFYSARPGMVFGIRHNIGPVTVRGCTVTWLPGSDRVIASWRDGTHCKNNRIGPLIENCRFEGLFDDSINLSADAVMAKRVIAPNQFELTSSGFEPGDQVGVFRPDQDSWDTGFSVVESDGAIVMLNCPVDGIIVGEMRPKKDVESTQFYNLSCANDGFIVRNNFFGIQRRHAVLARCRGLIENNVIDGVCGRALEFCNEFGSFYEGPFPRGLRVCGNRISNTAWAPVVIRTKGPVGMGPVTGDILFEDNEIFFDDGAPVEVECSENVTFKGNRFFRTDGTPVSGTEAVETNAACRDIRLLPADG
ncbi:right-handed parallel beta-helix repeat-containing protein [Tichowtungia aerotolerans]|uniref:Right-handed parallel beta-helix repeat-containing protein n=1 Tax=Tichowtungia aerotolerans TaxID=2697043 RepID=A0A6P1MC95_9BACT|nr:right-handed parallel beta-helix repeat-containing protein [Tichowtungia aerotolerans]QHI69216.1 hypothetical protein GT409_07040 [Tichowtungia aerotolerans]